MLALSIVWSVSMCTFSNKVGTRGLSAKSSILRRMGWLRHHLTCIGMSRYRYIMRRDRHPHSENDGIGPRQLAESLVVDSQPQVFGVDVRISRCVGDVICSHRHQSAIFQ